MTTHALPVAEAVVPKAPGFYTPAEVRAVLLARQEILFADLREEGPYAQGHPLWAANLPLARIELDAARRIPRRDVLIVLYGADEHRDLAEAGKAKLCKLGYSNVNILTGGLDAWQAAGYEMFIDVNVPSKAFGELVEARRHTPLYPAEKVAEMIASDNPPVVLDARRFDEFNTMSIPTGISVPGAELVLRARSLAPDPTTPIIINCAGRTRSIIGTQSLINAGLPNPIAGLRNGTIGWILAGLNLDEGADRRFDTKLVENAEQARIDARNVADRAGVKLVAPEKALDLAEPGRTVYFIDVRQPEEYAAGHLSGFQNVPGGQLVQETDHTVPVRGARIVLTDDNGVRADMSASWLAQMGWEVWVTGPVESSLRQDKAVPELPQLPQVSYVTPHQLRDWLAEEETALIDLSPSRDYVAGHIPSAWFALRSELEQALAKIGDARRYVLTCGTSRLAAFAAADLAAFTNSPVHVLMGGTVAWRAEGLPLEAGETRLASPRVDRYRRPYEGTDAPRSAMEAYLEWEYGLVAQLDRDATHFFWVM